MAFNTQSLVQSLLNKNRLGTAPVVQQSAPAAVPVPAQEEAVPTTEVEETPAPEEFLDDEQTNPEASAAETIPEEESAPDPLYPELREKVDQAESLLNGDFLPVPATQEATEEQREEAADLIQAYFELTKPEDRDHVIILLAANPSEDAENFFITALQEDPDSYIQSQAAEVLCLRGNKLGLKAIKDFLEGPEDIAQFNHAIRLFCKLEGLKFAPTLLNIWNDEYRDSDERIEALLGLEQIMGKGLVNSLINFLDSISETDHLPEDELLQVLNVLERLEATAAVSHLVSLRGRLLKSIEDPDDILPLIEAIDSTSSNLS